MRPWTQLSASPHTVLFRWKSFVDHIDHAAPRAPRRWTTARPRKGRRGAEQDAAVDAHAERSTRVHWFGCGVRLSSPQGLASCGSSRGQRGLHGITAGHRRQEQAARPALLWTARARRPEVEEALWPLDGHRMVTRARIVHILTKVDKGLRPSQLSRPTSQPPTKVGPS